VSAGADSLQAAAGAAAEKARVVGRPILTYFNSRISSLDPLDLFDRAGLATGDRVFWEQPAQQFAVVGLGSAWACVAGGPAPFTDATAAWQICLQEAVRCDEADEAPWGAGPLALGGFAFSPMGARGTQWEGYPSGKLVLPRLTVSRIGPETWVSIAVLVEPDKSALPRAVSEIEELSRRLAAGRDDQHRSSARAEVGVSLVAGEFPRAADWKAMVRKAAQAARDGAFTKVVLARAVKVRGIQANAAQVLWRLREGYPGCTLFAASAGDRCFLGATPERLIRVRNGEVSTAAIAGSAPRGATEEEDRRLGEGLLASPKERLEHAVVVDVVKNVTAEVCSDVRVPTVPELLRVANVQHLSTPLLGRLRDRLSVLELVDRLHPTPAVGGFPRRAALPWIEDHEGLDRGWYAGPIGWIDHAGEGEFAVAIRSAILHRSEAVLYAGCGIVADSDPEQEYAESVLKLRPLLSALRASGSAP
jgi:isochorismate synthase